MCREDICLLRPPGRRWSYVAVTRTRTRRRLEIPIWEEHKIATLALALSHPHTLWYMLVFLLSDWVHSERLMSLAAFLDGESFFYFQRSELRLHRTKVICNLSGIKIKKGSINTLMSTVYLFTSLHLLVH